MSKTKTINTLTAELGLPVGYVMLTARRVLGHHVTSPNQPLSDKDEHRIVAAIQRAIQRKTARAPIVPAWGPWVLEEEWLILTYVPFGDEWGPVGYEVDLERCRTSAQVLDWIVQVASKRWATPEVVGSLVQALDACLDVQATLCSWGTERGPLTVTRESVRADVLGYTAGREADRRLGDGVHRADEVLRAMAEERAKAEERYGWA